jgi:hypothetical protein
MKKKKTWVLLPCPPLRAKLTGESCVAMWRSGLRIECGECGLAKERGAKGKWESKPSYAERARANALIARWGKKGATT